MDEKYLQDFYNRIVNRDPSYKEKMPFETFKVKMQDEAYNTKMQNWLGASAPPQNAGVDIDAFLGKKPVKKKNLPFHCNVFRKWNLHWHLLQKMFLRLLQAKVKTITNS